MTWDGEGEPPIREYKIPVIAHRLPVFFLAHFFKCSPQAWDNMPPEQVIMDYYILSTYKEIEAKEMEKLKRENDVGGNKGRSVKTTSDADFFERMNAKLGYEDG
tara:strand:- start:436 stop:747 length:312 start_codon:yes stop_codon:yes gene_type:complete